MSNEFLAKKIAELLDAERPAIDLAPIQQSLNEINVRIDKLEASAIPTQRSEIQGRKFIHPSREKFSIAEAIADQIFGGEGKEKACTFEPNGKPCDHCSMCNSRGF